MRPQRWQQAAGALVRRLQLRARTEGDDRGATLIIALVFITVIAVAIAGVLTVTFANLRTTSALRGQGDVASAGEGAVQVAINELRRGAYTGLTGNCFGASDSMNLPPLPGANVSATVQCVRDAAASSIPAPLASFPYALLTLPQTGSGEAGVTVSINGSGNQNTVNLAGTVTSTGRVYADHGVTNITNGTLSAAECVIDNAGDITVAGVTLNHANPDPAYCRTAGTPDPNLTPPTGSQAAAPTPIFTSATGQNQGSCNGSTIRITLRPGVYSSASTLNNLTNSSGCGSAQTVYDFRPGVYWFNFTSSGNNSNNIWQVTRGTLVAGSPTELASAPVTTFPTTACDDPGNSRGVVFAFGSRSQWSISGSARVQVCAEAPANPNAAPVAIYGLKTGVGSVGAQSNCVTASTGNENGNNPARCRMIHVDGSPQVYVRGVTYAPLAWIDVILNGPYQGSFGGIVARRFVLGGTGNVALTAPLVSAPPGPGEARTVVQLTVYLCPGSATCSTSGERYLTATVGLRDPSGTPLPGQRQVTVYSWSISRGLS